MNHPKPCPGCHFLNETVTGAAIVRIAAEAILTVTGRDAGKALELLPKLREHLHANPKETSR